MVDWAAIFSGTLAAFFTFRTLLYVEVANGLLAQMIAASLSPQDRAAYISIADPFFFAVEQMSAANSVGLVSLALYPFVGMLRLFKSFEAQPRLAIVTATLKTAAPDFGHFMLVIACVFACLLVSGILFLGQDMEGFTTPEHAFRSSLLAVLGHWDWEVLNQIGHFKAAFWLWVFSIVLSLIALNMLLAIILDAYSYEKEKASEDKSSMMSDQSLINPDSLMSTVPQMPREQAVRTLSKALERQEKLEVGFQNEDMIQRDYCGRELGSFITLLAKGNPKNVELLFTRKPNHHSWAWEELLEARECFLTLRCAKQYMGFISERLFRARDLLKGSEGESDEFERGSEFSKLLYHAHHKMLDLGRILRGGCPMVALSGKERQEVLELRLRRPSRTDAQALLEKAEAQRAHLASELKVVEASKARPAEVDANALNKWLRSVRVRMALGVNRGAMPRPLGSLPRTRSCEEQQAIKDLIDEIAFSQKIKVVIAGRNPLGLQNGATIQQAHASTERSMYFGLQSLTTTFKQHFPGAAGGCDVEISGWEARHALQMLAEDNPAVIGVLSTPSAFVGEEWRERLLQIATKWTDRGRLMVHWYNHARRNFQSYIKSNDSPLRKRYVHVLRPLLSVAWQRREKGSNFPPLDLAELLQQVTDLGAVAAAEAAAVSSLIHQVEELPEALPRSSQLDELIVRLLQDEKMPSSKPSSGLGDLEAF
eukprot:g33579.t1